MKKMEVQKLAFQFHKGQWPKRLLGSKGWAGHYWFQGFAVSILWTQLALTGLCSLQVWLLTEKKLQRLTTLWLQKGRMLWPRCLSLKLAISLAVNLDTPATVDLDVLAIYPDCWHDPSRSQQRSTCNHPSTSKPTLQVRHTLTLMFEAEPRAKARGNNPKRSRKLRRICAAFVEESMGTQKIRREKSGCPAEPASNMRGRKQRWWWITPFQGLPLNVRLWKFKKNIPFQKNVDTDEYTFVLFSNVLMHFWQIEWVDD